MRPEPPPFSPSPEWQVEADEVVQVTRDLTEEQVRIARFWADGVATETPPGHWVRIALDQADADDLDLATAARVAAWVSIAQA